MHRVAARTILTLLLGLCSMLALLGCRGTPYRARILDGPVHTMPVIPSTPAPMLPPSISVPATPGATIPPGATYPSYQPTPTPALPPTTATPGTISPGGSATTQRPAAISLRKVGPTQARVGSVLVYRIEVQNAGPPARGVLVNDQLEAGLTYLGSTPEANVQGQLLEWQLGDLASGQSRMIEVNLRAERSGVFNNCASVRTADGQTANDCISTAVLTAELDVTMSVRTPEPVPVGQSATFKITVTNRSDLTATNLLITDRYEAGLEHQTGANPIERDLGELAPGASRAIDVTFTVTKPGQLCNEVVITGDGGMRGTARSCIVAAAAPQPPPGGDTRTPPPAAEQPAGRRPSVAVKMSGPASQSIDGVAEFFIDVTNDGDMPLSNLVITNSYDPSLYPVQATQGYVWDKDNLVWTFPSLEVGKTLRLQLNCKCLSAAARACNRVSVTSDQRATGQAEACLEIRSVSSQLSIDVLDTVDPVAAGKELTYLITIKNNGTTVDRNIKVLAIVPSQMSVIRLGTYGPQKSQPGVDPGGHVRFPTIREIKPGESLDYRVHVRALEAADTTFQAVVKTDGMEESMTVEEKTSIVATP